MRLILAPLLWNELSSRYTHRNGNHHPAPSQVFSPLTYCTTKNIGKLFQNTRGRLNFYLIILCKRFILEDILGRILDEYGMKPIFECIPFHPAVFLHLSVVCYDCMKFRLSFIRWEYCQQVLSVIDFENSHSIGLFLGVGDIDFF